MSKRTIKSMIWQDDIVENKEASRTASSEYLHVYVENCQGEIVPALYTKKEIQKGIERAEKNPEDIVERDCGCWSKTRWMIVGSVVVGLTLFLLKIHGLLGGSV